MKAHMVKNINKTITKLKMIIKWIQENKKWVFGGIGTTIFITVLSVIISKDNGAIRIKENQNSGQQSIIANIRDSNISVVQNQGIDPCKYADTQKALGKFESELEKTKGENQQLQSILDARNREDKELHSALEKAENIKKIKVIARIFQEFEKGNITKEEFSKLADMVNNTPWEDLKSFFENKNIQIDKHNQSLVVSGIFMAKVRDDRLRARYSPAEIDYVLTPEGDKLYEITKTANLE